jgi:hypothetical protein
MSHAGDGKVKLYDFGEWLPAAEQSRAIDHPQTYFYASRSPKKTAIHGIEGLPRELIDGDCGMRIRKRGGKKQFGQSTPDGLPVVSLHHVHTSTTAWLLVGVCCVLWGIFLICFFVVLESSEWTRTRKAELLWLFGSLGITSLFSGGLFMKGRKRGVVLEVNEHEIICTPDGLRLDARDVATMRITKWKHEYGKFNRRWRRVGVRMRLQMKDGTPIELPVMMGEVGVSDRFAQAIKSFAPYGVEYDPHVIERADTSSNYFFRFVDKHRSAPPLKTVRYQQLVSAKIPALGGRT